MLAKLLAEEDITILRESVSTASFDIVNRVLRLPVWTDMSENVEDLLISHEVGHAKYTSPEYFIREDIKGLKHLILNIVEDNRIERFIKSEYPVFKSIFNDAYKELYTKGFFGQNKHDLLIDKINIYSKAGTNSEIQFTPEEEHYFDKVNSTLTPEDCLEVMEELYNLTLEEVKDEEKTAEEIETDIIESSSYSKFQESIDSSADLESIYNNYSTENKFNLYKNLIVTYDIILNELSDKIESVDKTIIDKFIDNSKTVVSVMVKEFEMRKAAEEYKRTKNYKTGELNLSKIYKYRISDNIFKTKQITNTGKNHGVIILFDWSSSMGNCILDCIDQIYNLTEFCRKIKIPFKVYAFTSIKQGDRIKIPLNSEGNIQTEIHLLELFSSEMESTEYYNMVYLLMSGVLLGTEKYKLNLTPLNSSLIYINDIMYTFKKRYELEKTSLILMTDGDDTQGISMSSVDYNPIDGQKKVVNSIIDSITKLQYTMGNSPQEITNNILRMIKDRNKSSIIVYYLTSNQDVIKDKINKFKLHPISQLKHLSQYKSEFIDKYFFMNVSGLSIEEKQIDEKNIENSYSDMTNYNKEIRIMLQELIKELS